MIQKKNDGMGLRWLMLAVLFLCNPTVGFVDILPDCIGFLMLTLGLSRLADLNEHLADAKKKFQILFFAGLGQLFATWLIYGFMTSLEQEMHPYEKPMAILLCTFVVAVLYLVVAIPAFRDLFSGLDRLGERFGGCFLQPINKAGKRRSRQDRSYAEGMKRGTVMFYIAFALLSVLPEFSVLTAFQTNTGNDSGISNSGTSTPPPFFEKDTSASIFSFDLYSFVELLRIGAVVVCLIFSLLWLCSYLRYFRRLRSDRDWIERLHLQYEVEILPQVGMLTMRKCTLAFRILCVGILFSLHFRLNYYAAFPGLLLAAFVLVAGATLGNLLPKAPGRTRSCVILAVVSSAQMLVNHWYLSSHLPEEALYRPDVFWHYFAVMLLDVAEITCTLVVLGYLLHGLYVLATRFTGVNYLGEQGESLSQSATQRLHRSFFAKLRGIFIWFAVAAVGNIADTFLHLSVGWIWLLPFACSLVALCLYYTAQNDLLEEIRFHFEGDTAHKKDD